ncbi:FRG domain-containing protein [uncultured Paludibaculum sp.]|uniref:FRG domain-containing protein n=1 Tax=uncultured Paludibaculum sp. TaxID=1765020 RepID=UPI002AAB4062|nr:FRG domain-containing protein [uncultured Paludibaculum sp.]
MRNTKGETHVRPQLMRVETISELFEYLAGFPAPRLEFDFADELTESAWIFRGTSNSLFKLEPSIERCASEARIDWAALEAKASEEFKYRAQLHVAPPTPAQDELAWLALMQHYGIPTRLLDFTLSPFVALYFAARSAGKKGKYARVWALDWQALSQVSANVVTAARRAELKRKNEKSSCCVSLDPHAAGTNRDSLRSEALAMRRHAEEVLAATGTFRVELNRRGCACVALPPSYNPRLANQQGLFLLNGAEDLCLSTSLAMMMTGRKDWCRAIDIPVSLLPEIERRLYQMNIHEQVLFPDMSGLAGLISQRIRLHWT